MRNLLALSLVMLAAGCSPAVYRYNAKTQNFIVYGKGPVREITEHDYKTLDGKQKVKSVWEKHYDSRTNLIALEQDGRPAGTMRLNHWAAITEQPRRTAAPWYEDPRILDEVLAALDRGAVPRQKDYSIYIQPGQKVRWDERLSRWEVYDLKGHFFGYWLWDKPSGMWQFYEGGW